jgi:hypothetical protein
MEKYIIEKKKVFTYEFCDEIVALYNNTDIEKILNNKENYYKSIIKKNDDNILLSINLELKEQLKEIKSILMKNEVLLFDDYNFLKFEKDIGFISYSNNFTSHEKNIYSYIDFIIFLNDISEGGEVEISGCFKIKPEKGTLLLFPSGWCFPYSHKISLLNDKYIISGKIYTKF